LEILGGITIDNKILSIIAGYIATGMDLHGMKNVNVKLDKDTITLGIKGKNIVITNYSSKKPGDNVLSIVLNREIKDLYIHTIETPGSKRREWITAKSLDIYCFTGAFIGFYLKTSDLVLSMEEAIDIVKSMKNNNPVSQLWDTISYYRMYKRLLEGIDRLLSRREILEGIALDRSLNIVIGFKNTDSSLIVSRIILWGRNMFSTQPVRRTGLAEGLPLPFNANAFICFDISDIKTDLNGFICNDKYCCIYGDDPVKLAIQVEKKLSVKSTW